MKMRMIIIFVSLLIFGNILFVSAVTSSASYVTHTPRASFQTVYGSDDRLTTYWPILANKENCTARQDLILQVAPGGCEPMVVRSDLLAEQNVPVFCQIDAMQINPLIDIEQIRSITFTSKYPEGVVAAGFHPAKAALRTRDKLLGSPLINNIGYVVIVLKQNEIEKNLPDFINVNLTGTLTYEADNAYGVGKAEFILNSLSDLEWENSEAKYKDSFWNGRYFVRLERVEPEYAVVSIYEGKRRIATTKVENGKVSDTIWVSGAYCQAGVNVAYDGMVGDVDKAILEISNNKGTDRISVYEGSRFIDDRCVVQDLKINPDGLTGNLIVRCSGGDNLALTLTNKNLSKENYEKLYLSNTYNGNGIIQIFFDSSLREASLLKIEGKNVILNSKQIGEVNGSNHITIGKPTFDDALKGIEEEQKDKTRTLYELINGASVEGQEIITKKEIVVVKDNEFDDAIASLEKVADEYPSEREKDVEGSTRFGEMALLRAIALAEKAKREDIRIRLMRKFIDLYPDSSYADSMKEKLNMLENLDFSDAVTTVEIENDYMSIQIVGFKNATKKSSAMFSVTGARDEDRDVFLGELSKDVPGNEGNLKNIRLERVIDEQTVVVSYICYAKENGKTVEKPGQQNVVLKIGTDSQKACERSNIKLDNVDLQEVAKIRLLPEAKGAETRTNLSVTIGIEKRAIKLSTEKTAEMIESLNKSIEKWENINEKLGKVVEGLKGACLATAGVLTVKNFFAGLDGEALARKRVMEGETGWNRICADLVSAKNYSSLTECYNDKASDINSDVAKAQGVITQVNSRISNTEAKYPSGSSGGILGGSGVDTEKAAINYCKQLEGSYGSEKLKDKTVNELLGDCEKGYKEGWYSYNELREIEYNVLMKREGVSSGMMQNSNSLLSTSETRILEYQKRSVELAKAEENKGMGLPATSAILTSSQQRNMVGEVKSVDGLTGNAGTLKNQNFSHVTNVYATYDTTHISTEKNPGTGFTSGIYELGLNKGEEGYSVQEVFKKGNDGTYTKLTPEQKGEFLKTYGIGSITSQESVSYQNTYQDPEVRFFETEPNKGMPAIVPFDKRNGWYAATKQTVAALGGINSYDESGRVVSFYLCNVGKNGREQFFEGIGDDLCQQINLNTGQPVGLFYGLSESEVKQRVAQGLEALNEAAKQYGSKQITIRGETFYVGDPAANIPTMQCQNFMSPEECQLLFNVCDPVICPSSRCDFGGKYPVADVIQTGIIGSTLLCLPNFKEGVYIPVCLTGIHAGIEGFVSILRNHRDCLQESLDTGKSVGICDQIYSIYLCEFFWRQIAPIAKVILPKIIENAYGQGTRGGGEYLSVMGAWQNMDNSIKYFTQTYAINSFKAFKARNIEEVGSEFCKAFISAKAPTSFEGLVEPESPPQFNAWFSASDYSDVTVPATSQYKVFYHIFAGNDQGVYYNVYLKNPPENSYYSMPASIMVASGFVGRGQYASETRDFTAPEGYRELCVRVNDQEECGFGKVSTSFAVDYLTDSYVSDESKETGITGESECVSGGTNLGALVTTTNLESGVEAAAYGDNVQRGIVRICATNNPGSQTDPTRFIDVGYCDDVKMRCWLDKDSVSDAITDSNVGVKEATLEDLEKTQRENLAKQGIIIGDDQVNAEIKIMKSEVELIKATTTEIDKLKVNNTIIRLEEVLNRVVLNHHKANLLYLIGDLKAFVVERKYNVAEVKANENGALSTTSTTPTTPSSPVPSVVYHYRLGIEEQISESSLKGKFIYLGNKNINIFLAGTLIWTYLPEASPKVQAVGQITDNKILLIDAKINALNLEEVYTLPLSDLKDKSINDLNNGLIKASSESIGKISPTTDSIYSSSLANTEKVYFNLQDYGGSVERYTVYLGNEQTGIYIFSLDTGMFSDFEVNVKYYINSTKNTYDGLYFVGIIGNDKIYNLLNKDERDINVLDSDNNRVKLSDNIWIDGEDWIYLERLEGNTLNNIKNNIVFIESTIDG